MKPQITIQVTDPASPEARRLIAELDAYLVGLYPPECNHLLSVEELKKLGVIFLTAVTDGKSVGCGAYVHRDDYAEIKRMYVMPEFRGRKIGQLLLQELEASVKVAGLKILRLETGIRQPEALRFYQRAGYLRRSAFGGYHDDEHLSVFMEKLLC
jgi:putative acetyltransferase